MHPVCNVRGRSDWMLEEKFETWSWMMKIKLQVGRDNDGNDDEEYDDVANILHADDDDDEAFDAIAVAKSLDQEPFAKTYKTSFETSYCCWGCSSENETFFCSVKDTADANT